MDIDLALEKLDETYDAEGCPTDATIACLDEIIAANDNSAELWDIRGDILQMLNEGAEDVEAGQASKYSEKEILYSYKQALEIDPECTRAHESLGSYYDGYEDNLELAETHFRKAIVLGAEADSYAGLARVLAQDDREDEALALISKKNCKYANEEVVQAIVEEIKAGDWR